MTGDEQEALDIERTLMSVNNIQWGWPPGDCRDGGAPQRTLTLPERQCDAESHEVGCGRLRRAGSR